MAADPDPTIKGSFVSVYWFLDDAPSTTIGVYTIWNSDTYTDTFYKVFSKGNLEGRKVDYQCQGRIFSEIKDGTLIELGPLCDIKIENGLPVTTIVTDPDDSFVHIKTTFQF